MSGMKKKWLGGEEKRVQNGLEVGLLQKGEIRRAKGGQLGSRVVGLTTTKPANHNCRPPEKHEAPRSQPGARALFAGTRAPKQKPEKLKIKPKNETWQWV